MHHHPKLVAVPVALMEMLQQESCRILAGWQLLHWRKLRTWPCTVAQVEQVVACVGHCPAGRGGVRLGDHLELQEVSGKGAAHVLQMGQGAVAE